MAVLGSREFVQDCDQHIGRGDFQCHYREPMASYPGQRTTKALLLAPVLDIYHPGSPWRIAMFTPSDQAVRFTALGGNDLRSGWHVGHYVVVVPPGRSAERSCFLYLHRGLADIAWREFHRLAHHEDQAPVSWLTEIKVHYYDFLSSAQGRNGHRGDGYEADLAHFREFRVGLATQHGYYPAIGDYLRPDRRTWLAMRTDKQGPAQMSLQKMKSRIDATRQIGVHPAVYLHTVVLDEASPLYESLRDSRLVDTAGQPMRFGWSGPDTAKQNWHMSLASPKWRKNLLQQARWIMELLDPDAIVLDETFLSWGYDEHPDRRGPLSKYAIDIFRQMRSLLRSFGPDKALLSSDCGMAAMVLWADGECGDHAYTSLLGHQLYRQEPVRYLAALGTKPWRPCSWHFQKMWAMQMDLARKVGAGVGVSNGWLEYTGLHALPQQVKKNLIADIESLWSSSKPK